VAPNVAHYSSHLVALLYLPSDRCGQFLVACGWADLKNDKASNITVDLAGESLTHLIGTFIGPEDTPYQGGTYEVVSTGARWDLEHQHRGTRSPHSTYSMLECVSLIATLQLESVTLRRSL